MSQLFSEQFQAIGTTWQIDFKHTDSTTAVGIFDALKKRIEAFEKLYSRFRKDSLVYEISQTPGVYLLPEDAVPMFDLYRKLYDLSKGKVTPLIGQALHDTGYDAEYSLTPKKVIRTVMLWDNVMKYAAATRTLTVYVPVQLDFGAIGKGYIIDIVSTMLKDFGIKDFIVDAGRDMYYTNEFNAPLEIGLENPFNVSEVIGTATITHGAICGTSGNRRAWSTYTHIINPETLSSPQEIEGLWVTAETTMLADSLTTAIFFTPIEILKKNFVFEYAIVYKDGSAFVSERFPGKLF